MDSMLPGSAALTDLVEKSILVVLRDGRHLKGILATYDQFANIVLLSAKEHIYDFTSKTLCIIDHGHFVIRGENVGILGLDDASSSLDSKFRIISHEEALESQSLKLKSDHDRLIKDSKILYKFGFSPLTLGSGVGTMDLEFNIPLRTLTGSVTWTCKNNGATKISPKIVLNAVGFLDVQVDIDYEYDGNEITAFWKGEIGSGETRTVTVKYKVINPLGGLYFNVPSNDYPGKTLHAITDNESERARYWLPCIDYPVVRTPLDFIIHYDSNFTCYTNGIMVKSEDSASRKGMTTSHFQNEFLTPSYLICIAVGDFVTVDDESVGSIPIKYIAPKRFDLKDLKRSFGETPQMMKWLQEKLDYPFPWKKYDQIVSIHIGGIFIHITKGAMENISLVTWADLYLMDEILHSERGWAVGTIIFIDYKECTNIHEMAHTYFGDLIVMRHFDHVWLKESWATYFEALWLEHSWSENDFKFEMFQNRDMYVAETNIYTRSIVTKHFEYSWAMFDAHTYPGGAWRIHMLRNILGDTDFWKGVQNYVKKFAHKTVETSDLGNALKMLQWFHSCGFPKIEGKFSVQIEKKTATLGLEQVQKPPFNKSFDITLEVELIDFDGAIYHQSLQFIDGKAFAKFSIGEAKIKVIRVDPKNKVLFTLDMNPGEEILESSAKEAADIFTRIWAYTELIKIGTYSSFSRIEKHIYSEPFYGVRIYVARALSKALFSEARKILGQMLVREKDPKAMYRIASECKMEDRGMRNDLLEFLKSPTLPYQAKAAALEALGHQKCGDDVDMLLKIAKEPGADRHGIVCSGAIRGLGASRSSKAFDFLLASLDTPASFHERVRPFIFPSLASLARWMTPSSRSVEMVTERFLSILPYEEKQRARFNIVKGLVTLEARSAIAPLNSSGSLFDSRLFYAVKEEIQRLRESGGVSVSELLTSLEKVESRLLTLEAKNRELSEKNK